MLEALSYSFIQHAIIAGIIVSLLSGIIGSLIVVNRMVFLAGGIAHTSYGGIGMAIYFGLPIFLGASIFAVVAATIIALLTLTNKSRIDTIIGLIWAVGMAIGILFVDITPGYQINLMSYLFGSILIVSTMDIYYMILLFIVVLFIVIKYYREILAVSYDMEYASIRGINVKLFYTLILILSALSIVVAIKVVGLILVIAMLTIPVYIAEKLSQSLLGMMMISGIISTILTLIGLIISYMYNISSGASVILLDAMVLILFIVYQQIKNRIAK
jgi:zinc transport system permease protein